MSAHFKKKSAQTKQEIPTASMPDIIFILLVFFMVVTVMRTTDMLVLLRIPQAEAVEKIDQKRLIQYVYVGPEIQEGGQYGDAAVQVDDAIVRDLPQLRQLMFQRLRTEPRTIISMRVDNEVETGVLYDVQQEFREADALRINYSTNREAE